MEIVDQPKQKRHRRTKAEMKLVREIEDVKVNKTDELKQSVYVSKKLALSSEFTSNFIYNLKLNCYRLFPNTKVRIKFYKDNTLAKISEFNTGELVYDAFVEMDLWDKNNFANNQKYNYIVIEIAGFFEDIQSIGMMVRGLIR